MKATPMRCPDFEADVRLLLPEEGGLPKMFQGMRPDFHYDGADAAEGLWMIRPIFIDEVGEDIPDRQQIPQRAMAHFYIINQELRKTVHRQRLREGTRFQLQYGRRVIAQGRVTKLLRLHHDDEI